MFDFKKLTNDLLEAKEAAKASMTGEDGGSANRDCMTIALPRLNEEKVINAIKESGLWTRGKRDWIGKRYFISVPFGGQGNDRCRQVKAMCDHMKSKGYDVLMFCQID